MDCPRCQGMKIVDPSFVEEAQKAFVELMAELVVFANQNKLDHKKMPVLGRVAKVIRIIEML
jgi:uncharacterized protein (UPF0212 family)